MDCPRSATFVFRLLFTLAKFSIERQYAVAYVAGGLSGLPSSSEGSGGRGATALPFRSRGTRDPTVDPRFWPFECNLQSSGTLARRPFYTLHFTLFRPGGGYSVPLFAAQSRHEKPYPPISKIKCRLAFERQDGNIMPHSPAQRKRDFGNLKFCARYEM